MEGIKVRDIIDVVGKLHFKVFLKDISTGGEDVEMFDSTIGSLERLNSLLDYYVIGLDIAEGMLFIHANYER